MPERRDRLRIANPLHEAVFSYFYSLLVRYNAHMIYSVHKAQDFHHTSSIFTHHHSADRRIVTTNAAERRGYMQYLDT